MLGIYLSGTGNSRYALEKFLKEYGGDSAALPIEGRSTAEELTKHDFIVLAYPVQYSAVPKILRDFISENSDVWQGKKIFVIATMALFSGDGAGVLGRLLKKHGAKIVGGLHLQMPDSIADEKVLKRSPEKNKLLVKKAEAKISEAVRRIKNGKYPREGLGFLSRIAGFLSQRLWFGHKTKKYSNRLKIDSEKCIGCSKCVKLCPTENIVMTDGIAKGTDRCTLCYRCVNSCPKQAITLLGKSVIEQTAIEKYL